MRILMRIVGMVCILALACGSLTGCSVLKPIPASQDTGFGENSKESTDSVREENEITETPGEAPDPLDVVMCILKREITDLLGAVTEDSLKLYVQDAETIQRAKQYIDGIDMIPGYDIRLYTIRTADAVALIPGMEPAESAYLQAIMTVNSYNNTMGTAKAAAASVIRNLNRNNSYNYGWSTDRDIVYVAEMLVGGQIRLVTFCRFNENYAVETNTVPVMGDGLELEVLLYRAFAEGTIEALGLEEQFEKAMEEGKISEELAQKIEEGGAAGAEALEEAISLVSGRNIVLPKLERVTDFFGVTSELDVRALPGVSGADKTPEEFALQLAKTVAGRARQDYLQAARIPDSVRDKCLKAAVFAGTPDRIVRIDLSGFRLDEYPEIKESIPFELTEEEAAVVIAQALTSTMNGMNGADTNAGASVLTCTAAVSGLSADNAAWWLCYDTEDGTLVCAVTLAKNANGCFDWYATPVFSGEPVDGMLKEADGDVLRIGDMISMLNSGNGRSEAATGTR